MRRKQVAGVSVECFEEETPRTDLFAVSSSSTTARLIAKKSQKIG